jgi:hypothetical protein
VVYVRTGYMDTGRCPAGPKRSVWGRDVGPILGPCHFLTFSGSYINPLLVTRKGHHDDASLCRRGCLGGHNLHVAPPVSRGGPGTYAWFLSQVQRSRHEIDRCMLRCDIVPSLKDERPKGSGPYGVTY